MAKNRLIFYSVFGVYQLGAFIFTVIIDTDNTSALLSVYGYLSWFKYLSFVGVILIIVDFVWTWRQLSRARQEVNDFQRAWGLGDYDRRELNQAIQAVQNVLDENNLSDRTRAALMMDLNRLRDFRASQGGWR